MPVAIWRPDYVLRNTVPCTSMGINNGEYTLQSFTILDGMPALRKFFILCADNQHDHRTATHLCDGIVEATTAPLRGIVQLPSFAAHRASNELADFVLAPAYLSLAWDQE